MRYPEKRNTLKNQLQQNAIYQGKSQSSLEKIYRNNFSRISSITRQKEYQELIQCLFYCKNETDLKNKDPETLKKFHSLSAKLIQLAKPIHSCTEHTKNKIEDINFYFLMRNIQQENRIRRNLIRHLKIFIKELNRAMDPHFFAPKNEEKRIFVRQAR